MSRNRLLGLALIVAAALAVALPLFLIGGGGRENASLGGRGRGKRVSVGGGGREKGVSMRLRDFWRPGLQLAIGREGNRPTLRPGPHEELSKLFGYLGGRFHGKNRWQRCDLNGNSCVDIAGATSSTYTLTSADAGATTRVLVDGVASYPYGQVGGSTLGASLPARMPESSGRHTLIVSPDGSGTSCSVASPCSIRRAFGRAVSGDLIYARGNAGDYTGCLRIKNRDYSSSDPVTLETFPADFAAGRAATFTGCSSPLPNNSLTFEGDAGIRLRKLRFAARQNIELAVHETQHFEVTQSVFRDAGRSCKDDFPSCSGMGLLAGGGDTGYTPSYDDDIQIWNSVFTNDGGPGTAGVTNHDHAIYLCGGSGQTTGLEDGCRSFVIANNLLFDSPDGYPIQLGQSARNGFIVNNTIDNSTAGSPPACAIVIWGTGTWADSNDLIANNIITNVTGSGSNAVCASLGKNLTGNVVRNNLAYGVSGTPYDPTYGSYTGFTAGRNPPSTDPLYVNTTGTYGSESKDFHLQPGSPARGNTQRRAADDCHGVLVVPSVAR